MNIDSMFVSYVRYIKNTHLQVIYNIEYTQTSKTRHNANNINKKQAVNNHLVVH